MSHTRVVLGQAFGPVRLVSNTQYYWALAIPVPNTNTDDHKKSQNSMMMTMIVFNKQQYISMVSRQTIAAVRVQVTGGTK